MIRDNIRLFWKESKGTRRAALVIIPLGFLYFLIKHFTGLSIPCVFYEITGFACPGCGITQMCVDCLQLHFVAAFHENCCAFLFFCLYGCILLARMLFRPKFLMSDSKAFSVICAILLFLVIGFGIVRNLPGMEFLLPSRMREPIETVQENHHIFVKIREIINFIVQHLTNR